MYKIGGYVMISSQCSASLSIGLLLFADYGSHHHWTTDSSDDPFQNYITLPSGRLFKQSGSIAKIYFM